MKKFISVFLLILVLVFAFTACNAGSSAGYDNPSSLPGSSASPSDKSDGGVMPEAVIKTASAQAQTKDFDSAIPQLTTLIAQNGGYVFSSSVEKSPGYGETKVNRYAQYVIKIPAKNLDSFLNSLEGFLAVTSLETTAQDVSEELYDLESAIETLEKKQISLVSMLDTVDSSTQWDYYWEISDELDSVEAKLAKLYASLAELEGKIAYSTVTLYIREVTIISEAAEPTFGDQIVDTFMSSINGLLEIAKACLLVIVFMLPFALIGGVCALVIVLIIRGAIRRARKKAKSESDAQNK